MPTKLPTRLGKMENVKIIKVGNNTDPINFMDGLALLFIGLKLTGHLTDWTWVEILAPLWAPMMLSWFMRLVVNTFFNNDENEDEE